MLRSLRLKVKYLVSLAFVLLLLLNTLENKIANVIDLTKKKTDLDEIMPYIETKHFNPSDYNKFKCEKIKEKELVDKSYISRFLDNSDLEKEIAAIATKIELKADQNKVKKLQVFDSSFSMVKVLLKIKVCKII